MSRRLVPFAVFALVAVCAFAEKQPFERYQTIVDRQMFGPLPPGFDPNKPPSEVQKSSVSEKELTKEQEKLQSSIHFSVINVTPEDVPTVGFTDNSDSKAPRHYFLKVGESRDGWTVKEADAQAATMTVVKDDVEVSLTLGGNSSKDANATTRANAGPTPAAAGGAQRPGLLSGRRNGGFGGGMLGRRKQREQEEAARRAQAQAAAAEKEAERQAQAEQDKQQAEKDRAEQRQQLMAIQEELKRVREAKTAAEAADKALEENAENGE